LLSKLRDEHCQLGKLRGNPFEHDQLGKLRGNPFEHDQRDPFRIRECCARPQRC